MKHEYDGKPVKKAIRTTEQTLLGTNNCFSVQVENSDKWMRIVNFYKETLDDLLERRVVWWPIDVMELAPGVGIIHDPRIPRDKYRSRYCTCCCPPNLIPGPQRAGQLLDIKSGFRTEHRRKNEIGAVSIKSRGLPRHTVFRFGKCPDNWLYHMDLITDDDFEVTYWRADGPFDPENDRTPSTEDVAYSVADVGDDYRDAIRRAEKEHGGHTLSVDDPDPTMHAERRRMLYGDPPEVVEKPERRTLTPEEKERYARAIRVTGPIVPECLPRLAEQYAEKAVNPDFYQRVSLNDPPENLTVHAAPMEGKDAALERAEKREELLAHFYALPKCQRCGSVVISENAENITECDRCRGVNPYTIELMRKVRERNVRKLREAVEADRRKRSETDEDPEISDG